MAITSKLQVVTKDSNNKVLNRTVSYVNPETSDSDLQTFATAYTGLSRRTFSDIYRIDLEDITNATAPTPAVEVTPGVTIGNGAIAFTSPYFTAANEETFLNKLLCMYINQHYQGAGGDIVFDSISGLQPNSTTNTTKYFIYGTLSNGNVITSENYDTSGDLYIAATKIDQNYEFLRLYLCSKASEENISNMDGDEVAVSYGWAAFIQRFIDGTLNLTNLVADINGIVVTEYAKNNSDVYGTAPQISYNPSAGNISIIPTFQTQYAFRLLTDDSDECANIWARQIIGASIFEPYLIEGEGLYQYVLTNPNYSA